MRSKTAQTTSETATAATDAGVTDVTEPIGSSGARSTDKPQPPPASFANEARLEAGLALLRSCAEVLLTSDGIGAAIEEVFVKLGPAFELDAFAAFVATGPESALTLEAVSGLTSTAISGANLAA